MLVASSPSTDVARAGDAEAEDDVGRVHLELALLPLVLVQQIEGPSRDDLITRASGVALMFGAAYQPLPWLDVGLALQLDAGSVRHARFSRPDADGQASEVAVVEGGYWELWTSLMVRGHLGPMFLEIGWAPLILREDDARDDLVNTRGEADGLFVGSRSVAWTLGLGARIALAEALDLTLRLQFRIRYLVERGGEPLADDEETGQMVVWPFVGLRYSL
jgi:hypothetical protein